MRLPRDVNPQRLARALGALGYEVTRKSGSHIRLTTQVGGEHHEVIPDHDPLKIGTLSSVLSSVARHHSLTVEEVLRLLKL